MRVVLCALLCHCRHALRRYHPVAPLGEERVREIVAARAYEIEYTEMYAGNMGTEEF